MRHVVHFIVLGVVGFALGCASVIDTESLDHDRLVQARTWKFLTNDPPIQMPGSDFVPEYTYRVVSPMRDAKNLDADVARYIERALEARGLKHVVGDADLYVNYQLTLQPRIERIEVGFAQRYVPSHSDAPSYIVEGAGIEEIALQDLRLEIDMRERRGQIVWRGELARRLGEQDALALRKHVDDLIGRLPSAEQR